MPGYAYFSNYKEIENRLNFKILISESQSPEKNIYYKNFVRQLYFSGVRG